MANYRVCTVQYILRTYGTVQYLHVSLHYAESGKRRAKGDPPFTLANLAPNPTMAWLK
jgi:hypothetical protein